MLAAGVMLLCAAASARAQAPWMVKDARVRVDIRLREAPVDPETGTEIRVPDLGLTRAGAGSFALMDATGKPVPVAVVWQGEGRDALLLARDLQPGQAYSLYIGGSRGPGWNPKTSLLLETRRLGASRGETIGSLAAWQTAWSGAAAQSWGAGFVEQIFEGDNPFGERSFLSHYSGYLAPTKGEVELFTNSADASFVLINDQPFTEWTGAPSMNVFDKTLHGRKLPASTVPVKIDYYQAKAGGMMAPNMSLGWRKAGEPIEIVPASAFLHPGKALVGRYEAQDGGPVPVPQVRFLSYLGDGGGYLYEVNGSVAPEEVQGAAVEWHFDDGAVLTGADVTRIMSGTPGTQRVTVIARRGAASRQATRLIGFYGEPPKEIQHKRGNDRYVNLLMCLDLAKLDAAMLAAALPVLFDFGTDAQAAAFANAWLAHQPDLKDPWWLPAYVAHERALAQNDPQKGPWRKWPRTRQPGRSTVRRSIFWNSTCSSSGRTTWPRCRACGRSRSAWERTRASSEKSAWATCTGSTATSPTPPSTTAPRSPPTRRTGAVCPRRTRPSRSRWRTSSTTASVRRRWTGWRSGSWRTRWPS